MSAATIFCEDYERVEQAAKKSAVIATAVAIAFLSIACFFLGLCIAALWRRVASLQTRLDGQTSLVHGAGQRLPTSGIDILTGAHVTLSATHAQPAFILAISPHCSACEKLISFAIVLSRSQGLRLVFMGRGPAEGYGALVQACHMQEYPILALDLMEPVPSGMAPPHAIIVGPGGAVLASAPVNSRAHLELFLAAHAPKLNAQEQPAGPADSAPVAALYVRGTPG